MDLAGGRPSVFAQASILEGVFALAGACWNVLCLKAKSPRRGVARRYPHPVAGTPAVKE